MPALAVVQRRYIDRVMARTGHNKTHAARILGIDRRTLNRIIGREEARGASVKIRD
jgi:ActR/RegA family two-component response regulator